MQKVKIERINGIIYFTVNDEPRQVVIDASSMTSTFNVPVTFGGNGVHANRNFIGTLANMKVIIYTSGTYSIRYDANGGKGTMKPLELITKEAKNLTANEFTKEGSKFVKWNTEPDGSGIFYEDEQTVKNLSATEGDVINLYAIWSIEVFEHSEEYTFDGTNPIETELCLYDADHKDKNFVISFEIPAAGNFVGQSVLVNTLDENDETYPGLVFRYAKSVAQYELVGTGFENKPYTPNTTKKVKIKREKGQIYININDKGYTGVADHSSIKTFNTPVTFGGNGVHPERNYVGTLSNMSIIVY